MDWFEEKNMEEIIKFGVVSWKRFVDDIFLLFKDISKSSELLKFSTTSTRVLSLPKRKKP
jgi:hypothetical protein